VTVRGTRPGPAAGRRRRHCHLDDAIAGDQVRHDFSVTPTVVWQCGNSLAVTVTLTQNLRLCSLASCPVTESQRQCPVHAGAPALPPEPQRRAAGVARIIVIELPANGPDAGHQ
jgi:hypothetical protein